MKINQTLNVIALLCFGSAATAPAQHNQDELKQRVLAQAQSVSPDDYAFTRTVRSEQTSNGKTEQKVTVEKFDPTKPADARWTLVSVDGAAPSSRRVERVSHRLCETPRSWLLPPCRLLRNTCDSFDGLAWPDCVSFCRFAERHREGDGHRCIAERHRGRVCERGKRSAVCGAGAHYRSADAAEAYYEARRIRIHRALPHRT